MTNATPQILDKDIQVCLVHKIRQTANVYHGTPGSQEALDLYLDALERLAEYVSVKWRGERMVHNIAAARQRLDAVRVQRAPLTAA